MTKRRKKVEESDASVKSVETTPKKIREIDTAIAEIRKEMGEGSILPATQIPIANHIPTGVFILDLATLGGIPEGYASMIYGLPSSGKTTISKKIVGEFQKKHAEKDAVWIDTENLFDPEWAKVQGVDLNRLHVSRPGTGQEAVDVMASMLETWEVGLIVLDSIPGCVPFKIIEKSAEDRTMGELAALMGVMCSKILHFHNKERKRGHYVTIIMMNQFRMKLGLVFGDPRTLPGGIQINHLPSTKIELKNNEKMGTDKYGSEIVEVNEHSFKVTKAKHGSSLRTGEFRMVINPDNMKGLRSGSIDDMDTLLVYAKRMSLVTGGGSSWRMDLDGIDEKFKSLSAMEEFLIKQPDVALTLKQTILVLQRTSKGLPALPPDKYLFDWMDIES